MTQDARADHAPPPKKLFAEMTREELLASRARHQHVLDNPSPTAGEVGLALFANAVREIDRLLAELRVPDEAMTDAGSGALDHERGAGSDATRAFTAMIDAVREGKT